MDADVPEDHEVGFEIVEKGTKKGGKMLVASNGYSYNIKVSGQNNYTKRQMKTSAFSTVYISFYSLYIFHMYFRERKTISFTGFAASEVPSSDVQRG